MAQWLSARSIAKIRLSVCKIEICFVYSTLLNSNLFFFCMLSVGKSVRRRAASMETSKYEKRRGRVKKQVETLKNNGLVGLSGMNEASSPSR